MVVTLARVAETIEHAIAGEISALTPPLSIANQAGQHLVSMRDWSFLKGRSVTLGTVTGQSYIALPTDFNRTVSVKVTSGTASRFKETTLQEINNLRSYDVTTTNNNWYGAVDYKLPDALNFLAHTEGFNEDAYWSTSLTGVTANSTLGPFQLAGEAATADTLNDADSTARKLTGTVRASALPAVSDGTVYTFSVYLKKGTADDTSIEIRSPSPGTELTEAVVTWGATPTVAIGSSTGSGDHTVALEQVWGDGNTGWVRVSASITYDRQEGTGGLACSIYPAGSTAADTGTCIAWGAQLNRSALATTYYPVLSSQPDQSQVPVPVYELYPTPTADEADTLRLFYLSGWTEVTSDTEIMPIPQEVETLYLELVRAFARGYELSGTDRDTASIEEELIKVEQSSIYAHAARFDARKQRTIGRLRNGAIQSSRGYVSTNLRDSLPGPTTA